MEKERFEYNEKQGKFHINRQERLPNNHGWKRFPFDYSHYKHKRILDAINLYNIENMADGKGYLTFNQVLICVEINNDLISVSSQTTQKTLEYEAI